jgi:hypothetical protein
VRHIKQRMFNKAVRFVCRFPNAFKLIFNLYRNLIIYNPFIRTSFKWKLTREHFINFEIGRAQCKKGKYNGDDILLDIEYKPSDKTNSSNSSASVGRYKMEVLVSGLHIDGEVASSDIEDIYFKIDDKLARKVSIHQSRFFLIKIDRSILSKLPKKPVFTLETENGKKLNFNKSDRALLTIPFGTGELDELLEAGILLSKKGTVAESQEELERKKNDSLDLYSHLKDIFEKELGIPLFVMYGTLLGCIREGDFIKNDDDFDIGYVSFKTDPKEVKKETIDLMVKVTKMGFNILINPVGRMFKIYADTDAHLDVMPVWFEGAWNVAFAGAAVKSSVDDYLPVKTGTLRGQEVFIPGRSEAFLAGYYGPDWKIPDPGYSPDFRQTGKTLWKNYSKYLLTPQEFDRVKKLIGIERKNNPAVGKFEIEIPKN